MPHHISRIFKSLKIPRQKYCICRQVLARFGHNRFIHGKGNDPFDKGLRPVMAGMYTCGLSLTSPQFRPCIPRLNVRCIVSNNNILTDYKNILPNGEWRQNYCFKRRHCWYDNYLTSNRFQERKSWNREPTSVETPLLIF